MTENLRRAAAAARVRERTRQKRNEEKARAQIESQIVKMNSIVEQLKNVV